MATKDKAKEKAKELHAKASEHGRKTLEKGKELHGKHFSSPFESEDEEVKKLFNHSSGSAACACIGSWVTMIFFIIANACLISLAINAMVALFWPCLQLWTSCCAPALMGWAGKSNKVEVYIGGMVCLFMNLILTLIYCQFAGFGFGGVCVLISALATAACYAVALFKGVKLIQLVKAKQGEGAAIVSAAPAPTTAGTNVQPDAEKSPKNDDWPEDTKVDVAPANNVEEAGAPKGDEAA